MHKLGLLFSASLIFATSAIASAQSGVRVLTPSSLQWAAGPRGAPGITTALLAGTPNGTGWFVVRVKMSPGARTLPHTHKTTEILQIISGTLSFGIGAKMNRSAMRAVSAGSVVVIPAGVPHYGMANGTVVYDVSGMGPSTNIPVRSGKM